MDDAIAGYVLDDLWFRNENLYRVAGSPLLDQTLDWAGAIIVGQAITRIFVQKMRDNLQTDIAFFGHNKEIAASNTVNFTKEAFKQLATLKEVEENKDCIEGSLLQIESGALTYQAVLSRLPGEAGQEGAFYAIYTASKKLKAFGACFQNLTKKT